MAEITQETAVARLGWTVPSDLSTALMSEGRTPAAIYLASLAAGPGRRTMAQSLRFLAEEFSQGKDDAETFPWHQLTYLHTVAIRAVLADRYAPATANKMLAALRGVLLQCARLGLMQYEACTRASDLKPVKGTRMPKGRALSPEEVENLIMHAHDSRHRCLIRFLVCTGLRRSEAARLTYHDFVGGNVIVKGKGNKERVVPVPGCVIFPAPDLTRKLEECRVFAMSASAMYQVIRDAAFSAGLAVVTPHDLRRTYATRLLQSGVDLAMVQRLMGHASPTTTVKYDRRGIVQAAEAVNRVFV